MNMKCERFETWLGRGSYCLFQCQ